MHIQSVTPTVSAVSAPSLRDQLWPTLRELMPTAMHLTRSRDDAEELLQAVALRALEAEHQFAPGTHLKAWLRTIMINKFFTDRRPRSRLQREIPTDSPPEVARREDQFDVVLAKEVAGLLEWLVPDQSEAILLHAAGVSYIDAAAAQGVSCGTYKSRLSRGRARLLQLMEEV